MPCWDHKKGRRWCAGFFVVLVKTGALRSPETPWPPLHRFSFENLADAPAGACWRLRPRPEAPGLHLCPAGHIPSPCTPEGTGERIPPHGVAVPLRSAFGLRNRRGRFAPPAPPGLRCIGFLSKTSLTLRPAPAGAFAPGQRPRGSIRAFGPPRAFSRSGVPVVPVLGTSGAFYPCFRSRRPLFWDVRRTFGGWLLDLVHHRGVWCTEGVKMAVWYMRGPSGVRGDVFWDFLCLYYING